MRFLLAALLGLAAGAAQALDLEAAYARALRHDPSILAAGEAVLAGREMKVQGDALLLPQVSLSAGVSRLSERASSAPLPAESSGEVRQAAVQARQPLYDAKAAADRRQLHERTALAELAHRNARQDLLQRVSEAYLNALLAAEHLRVVQAEKAAVGMQRERAQARFEVGRARVTDVQETQARYDSVLAREIAAQSTLALRESQFEELTGAPATGLAPLRAGFAPAPPQPDSLAAWQEKGKDGNARVLAKRAELSIAAAELGKHALSGRPSLELVASSGYKDQHGGLSPLVAPEGGRSSSIGVQLSIPLFAGGALDSRQRESAAKEREARHDLSAAQRDARLAVQDAFLAVKTGVSRVGALEQSVLSARTALEATTLGRDLGSRTELDVLDVQQRLYAAQLELAQARTDYLLGRIRLAAAAGELDEPDLRNLNAFLER